MGKKAKFKRIRRMASAMPTLMEKNPERVLVSGATLIKSGVKAVEGKKVDPKQNYRQITTGTKPINHNRKMKRLYLKHGAMGVAMYAEAVHQYMKKQSKAALASLPEDQKTSKT